MNQLVTKMQGMAADNIKDLVYSLFTMYGNAEDMVMEVALDMVMEAALIVLEAKLPESEFIAFCDSL